GYVGAAVGPARPLANPQPDLAHDAHPPGARIRSGRRSKSTDRPRPADARRRSRQLVDQLPQRVDVALLGRPGPDGGPDDVAAGQPRVGEVDPPGGVQRLVQALRRLVAVDVAEADEVEPGRGRQLQPRVALDPPGQLAGEPDVLAHVVAQPLGAVPAQDEPELQRPEPAP